MTQPTAPSATPMQFDTAVSANSAGGVCSQCEQPIGDSYYTAGRAVVCAPCKTRIADGPPIRPTAAQIGRATLFGFGGAVAAAIVYYAVLAATGYNIGLIAIAAGFMVGRAVQLGARGKRSLAFQIAAVALTYLGIAAGMTPGVFRSAAAHRSEATTADSSSSRARPSADSAPAIGAADPSPAGSAAATPPDTASSTHGAGSAVAKRANKSTKPILAMATFVGVVLAIPVLLVVQNFPSSLITGFIIFIGLAQAWVMNRPAPRPAFHGPFRVAPTPTVSPR